MINFKEIHQSLRERYRAGETMQEIADSTGVSRTYLTDLLSGRNNVEGLTIKKINQLFPNSKLILDATATVNLHGDSTKSATAINNGTVNGNNQAVVNNDSTQKLTEVIDQVMSCDKIDPASKIEVYNIIKKSM